MDDLPALVWCSFSASSVVPWLLAEQSVVVSPRNMAQGRNTSCTTNSATSAVDGKDVHRLHRWLVEVVVMQMMMTK